MSRLIYRRIYSYRWLNAEDQGERDAILTKLDQTLQEVGGKRLVLIECDSSEALRQWNTLGLEIFPDLQAAEEYLDLLQEPGELQWIDMTSEMGTGDDFEKWLTTCRQKGN